MNNPRNSPLNVLLAAGLMLILSSVMQAQQVPTPDHVVIVMLENHAYSQIIGSASAPYINSLANDPYGALFTQSFGVTHPSQPNYLYLFSGSSQNVILDFTPFSFLLPFTTANLGASLLQHGRTFTGYSEDLPSVGFTGDNSGSYQRKHNPWVNWQDGSTNGIPSALNQPLTSFPSNYSSLPTLSFVIPNQDNDMHNGSIATADAWIQSHLDGYAQWAKANNSLLILTFDEDDGSENNRIATIFIGQMVKAGQYSEHITHNDVLRTLEAMYGLSYAGNSSSATTITDCWVFRPVSALTANPTAICPGETVTLTDMSANVPAAWSWSFPGGTPDASSIQNPVVSYDSAGVYEVTLITSNHMGFDTLVKANYITVNPFPSLSLSADSMAICDGDTATVTASGAMTYNWLPAAGLVSATDNTMSAAPNSNAIYEVTGSANGCPGDTVSVAIKVNPLPVVTVLPDSQTVCEGDSVTLTAQGADNFNWSPATGLNTTEGSTVLASPLSETIYIATGTDNNGCSSEAAPVNVLVSTIEHPVITPNDSILSSSAADSYQWYLDGQQVSTATSQVYIALTSGEYTVEAFNAEGCSKLSDPVTVTLTTGIRNAESSSFFTLYPNPNDGQFFLLLKGSFKGECNIELQDVVGRVVFSYAADLNVPIIPMNASQMEKGIYLLTITNADKKMSGRVCIY